MIGKWARRWKLTQTPVSLTSTSAVIDREILFAQLRDEPADGRFLGLRLWPVTWGQEESLLALPVEVMAEHMEGMKRIAEGLGHFFGGANLDEKGPQRFILALFGRPGLQEKAADLIQVFWCSHPHDARCYIGQRQSNRPCFFSKGPSLN
jgi:hypothetical protein